MDQSEAINQNGSPSPKHTISITRLDASSNVPAETSINGTVTLVWPFSSATQTTALLLAEPDSRLRKSRTNQVRVQFTSHAARAVASAGIGIGDRLSLCLDGAVWMYGAATISTPGRSVQGELKFQHRVSLKALRDGNALASISVNVPKSPRTSALRVDADLVPPTSPELAGFKTLRRSITANFRSSPAIFSSSPHPGNFSSPDLDFFFDDDGSAPGKGRKRTKFGRKSSEWRFEHSESLPKLTDASRVTSGLAPRASEDVADEESLTHDLIEAVPPLRQATPDKAIDSAATLSRGGVGEQPQALSPSSGASERDEPTYRSPIHSISSAFDPVAPASQRSVSDPDSERAVVLSPASPDEVPGGVNDEPGLVLGGESALAEALWTSRSRNLEGDSENGRGNRARSQTQTPEFDPTLPPEDDFHHKFTEAFDRNLTEDAQMLRSTPTPASPASNGTSAGGPHAEPGFEVPTTSEKLDFPDRDGTSPLLNDMDSLIPRPKTPESPRLVPVFSRTYPLISPLQAGPPENSDSKVPSSIQTGSNQVTNTKKGSGGASPVQMHDFGLDGTSFSRSSRTLRISPTIDVEPSGSSAGNIANIKDLQGDIDDAHIELFEIPGTGEDLAHKGYQIRQIDVVAPSSEAPATIAAVSSDTLAANQRDVNDLGLLVNPQNAVSDAVETLPNVMMPNRPQSEPIKARKDHDRSATLDRNVPAEPSSANGPDHSENDIMQNQHIEPNPEVHAQRSVPDQQENTKDPFDEFVIPSPDRIEQSPPRQPLSPARVVGDDLLPKAQDRVQERHAVAPDRPLDTPQASQETRPFSFDPLTNAERVDQILEGRLPLTPQQTLSNLSNLSVMETASTAEQTAPMRREAGLHQSSNLKVPIAFDAQPTARTTSMGEGLPLDTRKRKPMLRRSNRRIDASSIVDVPDPVSPWFTSRRSSRRASDQVQSPVERDVSRYQNRTEKSARENSIKMLMNGQHGAPNEDLRSQTNGPPPTNQALTMSPTTRTSSRLRRHRVKVTDLHTKGFRTRLSYYAPLSSLETYLAASSSQGALTIDLFAVVTSLTSKPTRAKKGPKDYNNLMHIMDPSIAPSNVQVQCFRPYYKSLPEADVGDIILLRDFAVKFRKDECFLLSAESSAWHIWRYRIGEEEGRDRTVANSTSEDAREEARGPPVELGDEERDHASKLRAWWEDNYDNDQANEENLKSNHAAKL